MSVKYKTNNEVVMLLCPFTAKCTTAKEIKRGIRSFYLLSFRSVATDEADCRMNAGETMMSFTPFHNTTLPKITA